MMSLFVCTYNACARAFIVVDPVPCGDILRVVFIRMCWLKYAATFQGRRDFEVWRDFEEIRYANYIPGMSPCKPKLRVVFKSPCEFTRESVVYVAVPGRNRRLFHTLILEKNAFNV